MRLVLKRKARVELQEKAVTIWKVEVHGGEASIYADRMVQTQRIPHTQSEGKRKKPVSHLGVRREEGGKAIGIRRRL